MAQKLYEVLNRKLKIFVPVKNAGKFRWKNRTNCNEYGKGFSTAEIPYTKNSYIEWQIGYDVMISDVESKPTSLTEITFTGANGKLKHPYELSEILFGMLEAGIISHNDLRELIEDVHHSKRSLQDEYSIQTVEKGKCKIESLLCNEQIISLPRFVYENIEGGPVIEVSIEKQQYATGVQPMLYISIPVLCLEHGKEFIGKTNKEIGLSYDAFIIDETNKNYIMNTFRLFAICSEKHKHDVSEILCKINEYVDWFNKNH